ncbi:response regulator [Rhizobium puerariae]|uniref:Response regulator n=1 Tax=Rhizobium puerariae TaxID=1585791 RepID=A0ABV6AMM3_9HYPH
MKNILIVDDDASLGAMLAEYFAQHDFGVSVVEDSAGLKRRLITQKPDLLLVDMNLGNEDGMDIVRALTEQGDVPIIIMSGDRLKEGDKVEGLELGARDYIAKPFSLREMLARVRSALRSAPQRNTASLKIYQFDGWRLNMRNRRLCDPSGNELKLTTSELNLLVALLEAPGQVLSREQLLRATRVHDQEIFDRSVDVTILRLRRKLSRSGEGRDYIRTQRGAGYFIDCPVSIESSMRLV